MIKAKVYIKLQGHILARASGYSCSQLPDDKAIIYLENVIPVIDAETSIHDVLDFQLMIKQPMITTEYGHCNWSSISERGTLGTMTISSMTITATDPKVTEYTVI